MWSRIALNEYLRYKLLLEATSTTRLTLRMCHGCAYTGSFVLDCHALYLQHFMSIEQTSHVEFFRNGSAHEFQRLKALINLNKCLLQWSNWSGVVNFHCTQMSLEMSIRLIFGDKSRNCFYGSCRGCLKYHKSPNTIWKVNILKNTRWQSIKYECFVNSLSPPIPPWPTTTTTSTTLFFVQKYKS